MLLHFKICRCNCWFLPYIGYCSLCFSHL